MVLAKLLTVLGVVAVQAGLLWRWFVVPACETSCGREGNYLVIAGSVLLIAGFVAYLGRPLESGEE